MKATSLQLYTAPRLTSEDDAVLAEIHQMRKELRHALKTPKRWEGRLRRSARAKAIQGSNSIEGINVAEDDAAAALDDEEPLSADEKTFAEIKGYQRAMEYVLSLGSDRETDFDVAEIKAMHFMLLQHEPSKSPGHWRKGPIYVHNDRTDQIVYEGPDAESVPELMGALIESLHTGISSDPVVRSAMAHLNLVMIHPFRDGNGRMGRAVAALVLTRSDIGEPTFSSIEEWLGANSDDYYAALAHTGHGKWAPRPDAHLWLSFCLRAHHMQAQTVARRIQEVSDAWVAFDAIREGLKLPERVMDALFDAWIGYRVRRGGYMKRAQVEGHTATRDLAQLAELGLLEASGSGRGRYYTAGPQIKEIRQKIVGERRPLVDPYPWMRPKLAEEINTQFPATQ
ncbi:Fic family protein [Catenulispora pinisilvae]|uniref:Fic family protein n=1 Tax=Catenulispora pinisilvae TaxID=2705253 RepID=UPI001890E571|nr:Fic family protein [Catenulispora pinisilvae]